MPDTESTDTPTVEDEAFSPAFDESFDIPAPAPEPDPPAPPTGPILGKEFDRPIQPGYALGMIDDPAPVNRYPGITAAREARQIEALRADHARDDRSTSRQYRQLAGLPPL